MDTERLIKEAKQLDTFLKKRGKKSAFNASDLAEYVGLITQMGETGKGIARDQLSQQGLHALADNVGWLVKHIAGDPHEE